MDTPRSDAYEDTRFSTPVSELDDHRFQPSSLPRIEHVEGPSHGSASRRGTRQSETNTRPDLLQPNDEIRGYSARDFEHAVIDEDSGDATASPIMNRRARNSNAARAPRSRASSSSSRSTSPPNSIDAFADPRRRGRTGTITSRPDSAYGLQRRRTLSSGAGRSRRPTICSITMNDAAEKGTVRDSAEDDVCYPMSDEPSKTSLIDYEALEEFVAEFKPRTPALLPRRLSFSSNSPNRDDPKGGFMADNLPKIIGTIGSPRIVGMKSDSDVASVRNTIDDEKAGFPTEFQDGRTVEVIPNRFSFFSSELDSTIHSSTIGDLLLGDEDMSFRDLFEMPPDGGVWWLDCLNPSEDEINALSKAFNIHPLTTEDIKIQEMREKVELFKKYYFVCFRSFYQQDKESEMYMDPVNIYMIVFREGIVTFSFTASPHAHHVRKRIGKLRDYVGISADWICYAMIDDIVDSFGPVIHEVELRSDDIEESVFITRAEDMTDVLRQIGDCRKKVMVMMRLLGGKADVIKGFAKRCNEQYSVTPRGEIGLYLGDIQDHVVTMMSNLGHAEKMLSRSHGNYLAQISMESISAGNRANEVLSKITLIATILVPLNLICGLFGMNVPVPGRESDNLGWFFGIVGVILLFVVICAGVARRMRMI